MSYITNKLKDWISCFITNKSGHDFMNFFYDHGVFVFDGVGFKEAMKLYQYFDLVSIDCLSGDAEQWKTKKTREVGNIPEKLNFAFPLPCLRCNVLSVSLPYLQFRRAPRIGPCFGRLLVALLHSLRSFGSAIAFAVFLCCKRVMQDKTHVKVCNKM